VIVALAVTRDGMPVRSRVLPGDTADVATVARIKEDLRAWRLGRCVFVGDAGMYSAANLVALSRGLGRYILATPLRKLSEIDRPRSAYPPRTRCWEKVRSREPPQTKRRPAPTPGLFEGRAFAQAGSGRSVGKACPAQQTEASRATQTLCPPLFGGIYAVPVPHQSALVEK
jgi:hypothetical protein